MYLSRCKWIYTRASNAYRREDWGALAENMPGLPDFDGFWTYGLSYEALCRLTEAPPFGQDLLRNLYPK